MMDEILGKTNAVVRFRWVTLQIAALCDRETMKRKEDVEERLGKLPSKLHDLYAEIYDRIENTASHGRSITEQTLMWLLHAQRQLAAEELSEVLPSDSVTTDEILDLCRNLVTHDAKSDTFAFAHLSVREFFEDDEFLKKHPEYTSGKGHATICKSCINLFMTNTASPQDHILQYASLYWPQHYQKSLKNWPTDDPVQEVAKSFLVDSRALSKWSSVGQKALDTLPSGDNLHQRLKGASFSSLKTICVFGLEDLYTKELFQSDTINFGLSLAIKWKNQTVVCLLLEEIVNLYDVELNWQPLFLRAADVGMEDAANLILKKNAANLIKKDVLQLGDATGWSLLHWMVLFQSRQGMKLLLESGAKCNAKDIHERTPLHFAAMSGFGDGLLLLLENGAEVDIVDEAGWTPWHWAAYMNMNDAQSKLLDKSQGENQTIMRDSFLGLLVSIRSGNSI
jgi:hypothetical protein